MTTGLILLMQISELEEVKEVGTRSPHMCTIPKGILIEDLDIIFQRVLKKCNLDYFKMNCIQIKQSLKEQIMTNLQIQFYIPYFNKSSFPKGS